MMMIHKKYNYRVSINVGYDSQAQSGTLSTFPIFFQFDTVKQFTDCLRRSVVTLADWSIQCSVPKSSMVVYAYIERDHTDEEGNWIWSNDFKIRCKNIREYQPLMKMSNEEIEALKRDQKIDEVINGEKSN